MKRSLLKLGALQWIIAPLSAAAVWAIYLTSRLGIHEERQARPADAAAPRPVIACFWHGQVFPIGILCVALRSAAPSDGRFHEKSPIPCVAPGGEGRLFGAILRWLGLDVLVAAAGAEGANPARTLSRALTQGASILLSADGPRGPALRAAPGLIRLAAISGAAILPIGFAGARCSVLPTWDRAVVPWPFARLSYVLGQPIEVPRRATPQEIEAARALLDERLNAVTAEAARRLRGPHPAGA